MRLSPSLPPYRSYQALRLRRCSRVVRPQRCHFNHENVDVLWPRHPVVKALRVHQKVAAGAPDIHQADAGRGLRGRCGRKQRGEGEKEGKNCLGARTHIFDSTMHCQGFEGQISIHAYPHTHIYIERERHFHIESPSPGRLRFHRSLPSSLSHPDA